MRRRLPPYGRQVLDRLAGDIREYYQSSPDGSRAQIFVAVGPDAMGWPQEHPRTLAVAVAPGEDPAAYRFDWAAPHAPVQIVAAPTAEPDLLRRTAATLMRDGASYVVAMLPVGWTRFERGRAVA